MERFPSIAAGGYSAASQPPPSGSPDSDSLPKHTGDYTGYQTHRLLLAGANPFVTLYDGDDRPTAYASVWRVDWSRMGSGNAVVLWHADRVRVVGDDQRLAAWIEEYFVRNFDEAKALPGWPAAQVEVARTEVRVDPHHGCVAQAGDITVRIGSVLDARPVGVADFPLNGVSHTLSMQFLPCATARITIGGLVVPGAPQVIWTVGRPASSAGTTVHEAWSV